MEMLFLGPTTGRETQHLALLYRTYFDFSLDQWNTLVVVTIYTYIFQYDG